MPVNHCWLFLGQEAPAGPSVQAFASESNGVGPAGLPGWLMGESKAPKPLPALRVQSQRFKRTYIYLHQRGNRFAF